MPVDTTTTKVTTETDSTVMAVRRRKRQDTDTINPINLDIDEISKLCRLVTMYRSQLKRNSTDVTNNIILYRVEPKVLLSALDEVRIAFGNQQNKWLAGFNEKLMKLWSSFVTNG